MRHRGFLDLALYGAGGLATDAHHLTNRRPHIPRIIDPRREIRHARLAEDVEPQVVARSDTITYRRCKAAAQRLHAIHPGVQFCPAAS